MGGAALVDERLKTDDVKFDFIGAVPVALRRQRGIYILDLEAAAIGHGVAGGDLIRYGARVGAWSASPRCGSAPSCLGRGCW